MGFIAETKDLVFGKLNMVSEKVDEKIDIAGMKANVTAAYTKAVATVESVPTYLKDAYKNALAKIDDLHIYDNAVYASSAVIDPTTYKKLFDSALNAVDAFKQALITFTKQTTGTAVDYASNAKKSLADTWLSVYQKTQSSASNLFQTTQSSAISSAVWIDTKFRVVDMYNWGTDQTAKLDNMILGGKGSAVALPVGGYVVSKAIALDSMVTGGAGQSFTKNVIIDFNRAQAMTYIK